MLPGIWVANINSMLQHPVYVVTYLEVVYVSKNLRLKSARAAKDMSQKEVAEAVNVTRQTINAIESGGYNPSIQLCIAICKILNKTLDQIFWEHENNDK